MGQKYDDLKQAKLQLETQLTEARTAKAELRKQHEAAVQSAKQHQDIEQDLSRKLAAVQEQLEAERDAFNRASADHEIETADLKARLVELEEHLGTREGALSHIATLEKEKTERVSDLKREIASHKHELEQAREASRVANAQLSETKDKLDRLEKIHVKTRGEEGSTREELEQALRIADQRAAELLQCQQELQTTNSRCGVLEQEVEKLTSDFKRVLQRVEAKKKRDQQLQNTNSSKAHGSDASQAQLFSAMQNMQTQMVNATSFRDLHSTSHNLGDAIANFVQDYREIERGNESLQLQIDDLTSALQTERSRYQAATQSNTEDIEQLTAERAHLQQENESLTTNLNESERERKFIDRELEQARKELHRLQHAETQLRTELNSFEMVRTEKSELARENAQLQHALREAQDHSDDAAAQLAVLKTLRREHDAQGKQLDKLKMDLRHERNELEAWRRHSDDLARRLRESSRQQSGAMQSELDVALKDNGKLAVKLDNARRKLAELSQTHEAVARLQEGINRLEETNKMLQLANNELETKLSTANAAAQRASDLQSKLSQAQDKLSATKKEARVLRDKLEKLAVLVENGDLMRERVTMMSSPVAGESNSNNNNVGGGSHHTHHNSSHKQHHRKRSNFEPSRHSYPADQKRNIYGDILTDVV